MSAPARLVAFAILLVVLFGGGYALGATVGPFGDAPPPAHPAHDGAGQ